MSGRDLTVGGCRLIEGDAIEVMAGMADASVDAVITDPPYHLTSIVKRFGKEDAAPAKSNGATGVYGRASAGFMNKVWDGGDIAFRPETWAEVLRVMKPGAFLAAFASTRGYHRMVCAIEDAGFIIHPMLGWIFASGFPKATRVQAEGYEGMRYGLQALKPSLEPICLAQRPFSEKTGTDNILRWGTGALNIDQCRVPTNGEDRAARYGGKPAGKGGTLTHNGAIAEAWDAPEGRWPPNCLTDGSPEVLAAFAAFGASASRVADRGAGIKSSDRNVFGDDGWQPHRKDNLRGHADTGSCARFYPSLGFAPDELRFFYSGKAAQEERNYGLDALPLGTKRILNGGITSAKHPGIADGGGDRQARNTHPTVKPVALMQWLCKLVTPPNGCILDMFCGSGSTLVAASRLGLRAIGIEREPEYFEIACERLRNDAPLLTAAPPEPAPEPAEPRQASLFGEGEEAA